VQTGAHDRSALGKVLMIFSGMTLIFLKRFGIGLWMTLPLLLSLAVAITLLGQAAGRREGWSRFDSFYWSFVTATTVGYGDMRPLERGSRLLAILIAFLGLVLTGIIVSIAVHAGATALSTANR
jgi:voltage-gated potassium channel